MSQRISDKLGGPKKTLENRREPQRTLANLRATWRTLANLNDLSTKLGDLWRTLAKQSEV